MLNCEVTRTVDDRKWRFYFVAEGCSAVLESVVVEKYLKRFGWTAVERWDYGSSRNKIDRPEVPSFVIVEAIDRLRAQIKYVERA